jgi:hypothetical protein
MTLNEDMTADEIHWAESSLQGIKARRIQKKREVARQEKEAQMAKLMVQHEKSQD